MLRAEVLLEILIELPRAVARLDLPVAKHVAHGQELLLEDLHAKARVLARPVVPVRKMERIDVPVRRRVLALDDFFAKLIGRADERAARLARAEKRLLIDLASCRVVND